ncbi:hypothetical protein Goshw_008265, partial [Gossypium schwendimanii]|nr:hypothetical protein [Gossypium schwendimanii]
GFLERGQYKPGVQVGLETHQCVNREVETRDAHIPSSMRRVYHHFGGRAITIGIAGGWVRTTRFVQSADWRAICYDLLGVISDHIYRGWIEMGCLRDTFLESGNDSTEVERIRYAGITSLR